MKKLIPILILLFGIGACEGDLELAPISDAGSNGFYNSEDDFIQAINGTYQALQFHPDRYIDLNESRSDNIYTPGQAGVRDWNSINNFQNTLATLSTIRNVWNECFNGIMRANTVLDRLGDNGGVISDASLRSRIEGEAKFLRALLYFDLVKWYGKLPLFETFVTPSEALTIGRSPVTDVYSLIISDLEFAGANLPASYSGGDQGRATSLAAKSLLAKVYLTRSGPQLHPDGPCLNSNEYDKALSLLNEVISSGRFEMLPAYASIFAYNNEGNKEIVWDIQYISGGLGAGALYPTGYYDEAWGRAFLPFAGGNPGDGSKRISEDLLATYEAGDLRMEPTFQLGYTDASGTLTDAKFFDKFMDVSKAGGDRFDWPINYPLIRYTDVLMMKAECILQGAAGSQAEVDKIVNDVRARAGLGPVSNVTLDMLLAERRKEFAGENTRWDVLVRTGKVLDVINAWIASEDNSGKMETVTANDIIYPIPQDQLDVKRGLYEQNPGY